MDNSERFLSVIGDALFAEDAVPIPCPMEIGEGRYVLDELIASGHRSWVYRATDHRLSSTGFNAGVIVKIFKSVDSDEQESLIARRIAHENIVSVIDRGRLPEGQAYLVEEYVSGGDLSRVPVPMPLRQAAQLVAELADAVQAMHVCGVVHCDLKPGNVLMGSDGRPKLADFELAASGISDSVSFRGTAAFMSPEQASHEPNALGPATDIYALAGVLKYLLTASYPKDATTEQNAKSVPETLRRIYQRSLSVDRAERHYSAAEFAADLRSWLNNHPILWQEPGTATKVRLWAKRHPALTVTISAAVLFIGAAAGASWAMHERDTSRERHMQAEALRLANEQIEIIKAKGRLQLRGFWQMIQPLGSSDTSGRVFPVLSWLEWLGRDQIFGSGGEIVPLEDRLKVYRGLASKDEQLGIESIDRLLVRVAIARMELAGGSWTKALQSVQECDEAWGDKLHPRERIRAQLDAIRWCALVDGNVADTDAARAALQTLVDNSDRLDEDLAGMVRDRLSRLDVRSERQQK